MAYTRRTIIKASTALALLGGVPLVSGCQPAPKLGDITVPAIPHTPQEPPVYSVVTPRGKSGQSVPLKPEHTCGQPKVTLGRTVWAVPSDQGDIVLSFPEQGIVLLREQNREMYVVLREICGKQANNMAYEVTADIFPPDGTTSPTPYKLRMAHRPERMQLDENTNTIEFSFGDGG